MIESKHLSEEQVAQCAEAINDDRYKAISNELRDHLAICNECAAEVLAVSEITIDFSKGISKSKNTLRIWSYVVSGVAAASLLFWGITSLINYQSVNTQNELVNIENSLYQIDSINLKKDSTYNNNKIASAENDALSKAKTQDVSIKTDDKSKNEKAESLQPAAYFPDENLEKLFQNFTMAYRGESISIISKGLILTSEHDSIKWTNPNSQELIVEFFNNQGEKIIYLSLETAGTPIPKFENGLYYRQLINKDFDLLHVGKIIVK